MYRNTKKTQSKTGTRKTTHLRSRGSQKVINLLVDVDSACQILDAANLGLDEMVTVDGGGDGGGVHARGHELQKGHLRGGILTGDSLEVKEATEKNGSE